MLESGIKCSTGPTILFPDTKNCNNHAVIYLMGDPYCEKCAEALRNTHVKITENQDDNAT
jgi:hypothetical protein